MYLSILYTNKKVVTFKVLSFSKTAYTDHITNLLVI